MKVVYEKDNATKTVKFSGTVTALLEKLKINPETVIVARNDTIIEKHTKLKDTDQVLIISVISGG